MNEDRQYRYPGLGNPHPPAWINGRSVILALRSAKQRPDWISQAEGWFSRMRNRFPAALAEVRKVDA